MAQLRGGSTVGGRPILGREARDNYIGKVIGNKIKESLLYDDGASISAQTNKFTIGDGSASDHSLRIERSGTGHSWEIRNSGGHLYFRGGVDGDIERVRIDSTGYLHLSNAGNLTTHAVRADRTISTGTGITGGGNLTANRTISLDTSYTDGRYLNKDGDTLDGYISPASSSRVDSGMYGMYSSSRIGHIWSMGTAYRINPTGADFGNLYGFAYKHTNNTTGGTMAGSHQAVWVTNGTPRVALGDHIWTSGKIYEGGTLLENIYAPLSRAINTGTGITGGGNLTANRTISFDTTWGDGRYINMNDRNDAWLWIRRSSTNATLYLTNQSSGDIVEFRSGSGDGTTKAKVANNGDIYAPKLILDSGGAINSAYNNDMILSDHSNGNVTLSATSGQLYLGYRNTTLIRLSSSLKGSNGSTSIADTDGTLYHKGINLDNMYVPLGRSISTGTGINGGGSLTANRTISLDTSYTDGRYVNKTGDSMTGSLSVLGGVFVEGSSTLNGDLHIASNLSILQESSAYRFSVQGTGYTTRNHLIFGRSDGNQLITFTSASTFEGRVTSTSGFVLPNASGTANGYLLPDQNSYSYADGITTIYANRANGNSFRVRSHSNSSSYQNDLIIDSNGHATFRGGVTSDGTLNINAGVNATARIMTPEVTGGSNPLYLKGSAIYLQPNGSSIAEFDYGNGSRRMRLGWHGYLKIVDSSSQFEFRNGGDTGFATVKGVFSSQSVRSSKKNIEEVTDSYLQKIENTPVYRYHYLDDSDTEFKRLGLILDEAPAEIVNPVGDSIEMYAMSTFNWKGIQELSKIVKDQGVQIMELRKELDELKASQV